jgi:metal-responsive CopG/Arc/MetJ family transcriptional regulator
MRAHIVLDKELVEEIDRIAGKRKRSQFIEEAVKAKLQRERLGRALKEAAGSLNPADYPEWSTSQSISDWVHNGREADRKQIKWPDEN